MNKEELRDYAWILHNEQIQEYPWLSTELEDAESYILTYGDTDVHLYYEYLISNNIGEVRLIEF